VIARILHQVLFLFQYRYYLMKLTQSGFKSAEDAEDAFYGAYATFNRKTMELVWADNDVVCVHPGLPAILGYDNVIRSWSNIFINSVLPDIFFSVVSSIENDDLAVHFVEEHIANGDESEIVIMATNVYQRFEEGWLMIEHHSSMIEPQAETLAYNI
jgi:SnoaL-like protein